MNSALKAIVAAVMAAIAVAHTLVTALPIGGHLTPFDWQTIIDALLVPLLVYAVPNTPPKITTSTPTEEPTPRENV